MLSAVRIFLRVSSRLSEVWKSIFWGSEDGEEDIFGCDDFSLEGRRGAEELGK